MKQCICFFTLVCFLYGSSVQGSNFGDTHGVSPEGIAMGNAVTAIADDWSSVYYNISGLGKTGPNKKGTAKEGIVPMSLKKRVKKKVKKEASSEERHINDLSVNFMYTMPAFSIDIERENIEGDQGLAYGVLVLGLAADLNLLFQMPDVISSARFGLVMGSIADGSVMNVNDSDPRTHNFLRYGPEAQKALIIAGLGIGFFDDMFGVGAGGNASFKGEGTVVLDKVKVSAKEQVPDGQSKMKMKTAMSAVAGIYFQPEKILKELKGLQVGASYRMESHMEIYPFKTAAVASDGALVMQMMMAIYDYYTPHIVTGGISYTRWGATLSLQGDYEMWSRFEVSEARNMHYANLPEFENVLTLRAGARYTLFTWMDVLAGFYYQPSFVPDEASTGEFNFLENDKNVYSLGFVFTLPKMWRMKGPAEFALSYQLQQLKERSVKKDNPASLNPDYTYGGICHGVSAGVTLKL